MSNKPEYADYLLLLAGSFIMAFCIKNIYEPVNLVTGGVSGISIILKSVAGVPLWLSNTVFNVPLFIAAWKLKGWKFIKKTLIATVALSISLYILPEKSFLADDILLASLFGGVLSGVGAGMVFWAQATTGGTDMLAALLQMKWKHYSIVQIMQVIDGIVVIAGATVFGLRHAMYALIAIYALAKISDGMLEGVKFAKQAYIISDKNDEIATEIMSRLDRGVTGISAVGMFSGSSKKMLYCVVSKKEIVIVKEIVEKIDIDAFVIVSDAREVLGEGFMEYKQI